MAKSYFDDLSFNAINFNETALEKGEYAGCVFTNCQFNRLDLSGYVFDQCEFNDCDWSMANLHGTALKEVSFVDCKLLGLHFEECSPFLFSVSFDNCTLNFSSFYKMKIPKTKFHMCRMEEVSFGETDLTQVVFHACDLTHAVFNRAILNQTDFRTALNVAFDPEQNSLKNTRFSRENALGLLQKYSLKIEG